MHSSHSVQEMAPAYPHQQVPPRPLSLSQNLNNEDGFVHVRPSPEPPVNSAAAGSTDFYSTNTVQRANSSQAVYNPLSGVPFEVNPMYDCGKRFKLLVMIDFHLFFSYHCSLMLNKLLLGYNSTGDQIDTIV